MSSMDPLRITKEQARRFILLKQGLLGKKRFISKDGAFDYIRQAGCIQYDPIDVCGKNAELVLQSRVEGFKKSDLDELLYHDRKLVDHFDKVMSIFPLEDWPAFTRIRARHQEYGRSREIVQEHKEDILNVIRSNGPVCSRDLDKTQKVDWYWSDTNLGRAVLESMYFDGDLVIHHRKNTMKYYDLIERHFPHELISATDPFESDLAFTKWRILRRISSVGFLWNQGSDAFIYMQLSSATRTQAFHQLAHEGFLSTFHIEGRKELFYYLTMDSEILELALTEEKFSPRTEFLAPLDNMLWDRKLIAFLFDFKYTWEIYTPEVKRVYGYYVLPILHDQAIIGRIEVLNDKKKKTLVVKNVWLENGVKDTKKLRKDLTTALIRFQRFNAMESLDFSEETIHKE